MRTIFTVLLIGSAALGQLASSAEVHDAHDLLAGSRAASGGAVWDGLRGVASEGTLATGGLSGPFQQSVDLTSARNVASYKLGPVEGASGYDGKRAWERDGGGEVAAQDTPAAIRRARSDAWLTAFGYWFPQRLPAALGTVTAKTDKGVRYEVLNATPAGGDPVALWFDAGTLLLQRTVEVQSGETVTTVLDDYREVKGARLPFHLVTDTTDAAGVTDPRRRIDIKLTHVTFNNPAAEGQFAVPEMTPAAAIDEPSGVTTIPFELLNNHIYVNGRVDGKPVRLLVDTGGVNLLTPAAARRLGIVGEGNLAASGVGDKRAAVALAHAKEVAVGGARLTRPIFYIIDLSPMRAVEGTEVDGLVGYEMFRRFGVTIDYAHQKLMLSTPDKLTPPAGAHAVDFTIDERMPVIEGVLDGLPIRMGVDTGSRASLDLDSPFVRQHELISRYHAGPEAVAGWGVGGPSRDRPARLGTLNIAGFEVKGIAGGLYTGDKGAFANPDLGGNLGAGVLRRFTVCVDYARKKIYLAPGAGLTTPDSFDRSGLWLMAKEPGSLEVADVAADSAAQRAGLAAGDLLVTIAGQPVAQRSLLQWRALLRESPAGTRVEVALRRGRDSKNAVLTLADRIPAVLTP